MFESYSSRTNHSAVDKLIQLATGKKVAPPMEEELAEPEPVEPPQEAPEASSAAEEPSVMEVEPEAAPAPEQQADPARSEIATEPDTGAVAVAEIPAAEVEHVADEGIDDRPFHEPVPEAEDALEAEAAPEAEVPVAVASQPTGEEAASVEASATEPVVDARHSDEGSAIGFHAVEPDGHVEEGATVEVPAQAQAEAIQASAPVAEESGLEEGAQQGLDAVAPLRPMVEEPFHPVPVDAAGESMVETVAEPATMEDSVAPVTEEELLGERPFHDASAGIPVPAEVPVAESAEESGTGTHVAEPAATEQKRMESAEEPPAAAKALESEPAAPEPPFAAEESAAAQEKRLRQFLAPGAPAPPAGRVRKILGYGDLKEEAISAEKYLPFHGEQTAEEADLVPSPEETTFLKSKTREMQRDKISEEELKELAQDPMWKTLMQFRGWLPVVSRVLPLLDLASGRSQSGAGAAHEIKSSMDGLLVSQRDVRSTLQNQTAELKRVEDEVAKLRDAADKTAFEQTALADDVRGLQRLFKNAFLYVGILLGLLVAVMGYMAFLVFNYLNHPIH